MVEKVHEQVKTIRYAATDRNFLSHAHYRDPYFEFRHLFLVKHKLHIEKPRMHNIKLLLYVALLFILHRNNIGYMTESGDTPELSKIIANWWRVELWWWLLQRMNKFHSNETGLPLYWCCILFLYPAHIYFLKWKLGSL